MIGEEPAVRYSYELGLGLLFTGSYYKSIIALPIYSRAIILWGNIQLSGSVLSYPSIGANTATFNLNIQQCNYNVTLY